MPDLFVYAVLGGGIALFLLGLIGRRPGSKIATMMGVVLVVLGVILGRLNGLLYW